MRMLIGNLILLAIFLFASKAWAVEYVDANSPREVYRVEVDEDGGLYFSSPWYQLMGRRVSSIIGTQVFEWTVEQEFILVLQEGEFDTWSQSQHKFVPYDLRVLLFRGNKYEEIKLRKK